MWHIKSMTALCLPLGVALLLSGCASMAPKYARPASPVPAVWPTGQPSKEEAAVPTERPAAEIPWKEFFVDPELSGLIGLALDNNRDLRTAALNIDRSRALYQIQGAALYPKVDAEAAGVIQGLPRTLSGSGDNKVVQQFTVGLGLSSYELDLFGRVQSLKDHALNQYLATEQAGRAVRISLVAQVASSYLNLAADQEQLKLAEDTISNQQDNYNLVKSRFDAGVASALDLQQARTSVDAARVDIARYKTAVALDENALNLVVGSTTPAKMTPRPLTEMLAGLKDITPGLSSDVLLGRPDILQAEDLLKGANANIGAARAAFFPRITLVSAIGFGSDDLAALFKPGSFAWQFAPRISLPIFDAGTNKANLKVSEIDREIAVAGYEKAVMTAFREVADALATRATIDDLLAARQSLSDTTAESYLLSQARYTHGLDSYLSVLDSQRSMYSARQSLITARLARLSNLVTLYRVLGGGGF